MTANETVAAVVADECRRRGWSRSQLARALGVNPVWVSRKLNNDRGWTLEDLDLVSERLGVPLPVLLMTPVSAGAGASTGEYPRLIAVPTGRYGPLATPVPRVTLAAA